MEQRETRKHRTPPGRADRELEREKSLREASGALAFSVAILAVLGISLFSKTDWAPYPEYPGPPMSEAGLMEMLVKSGLSEVAVGNNTFELALRELQTRLRADPEDEDVRDVLTTFAWNHSWREMNVHLTFIVVVAFVLLQLHLTGAAYTKMGVDNLLSHYPVRKILDDEILPPRGRWENESMEVARMRYHLIVAAFHKADRLANDLRRRRLLGIPLPRTRSMEYFKNAAAAEFLRIGSHPLTAKVLQVIVKNDANAFPHYRRLAKWLETEEGPPP